MSRLEELKGVLESWGAWIDWNESQRKVLKDLACLLERVQELEYASKYNGELNEFLQKRKLPPITLGRHVVDVVMDYAEELEKAFDELDDAYIDTKKENQRYKQALEYTQSELEYAHVTGNMNLRNDLMKKSLKAIDKALAGDNS